MGCNYKIGLVMKSLQADFFKAMQRGAEEFALANSSFELICVGTVTQTEIDRQIELMRILISRHVDAIVLVPIDSKALVPVTVEAIKAGIPVINIDIKLDSELLQKEGVETAFVGPDNFTAAYQVGRILAAKLQAGDNVALLEGLSVADNAKQRKSGFMKAIEEQKLYLAASAPADWETEKASIVFREILTMYPAVKAVFCSNDAMALGVLQVLKQEGSQIPVVGFDNDLSIQPFLQDGSLLATVDIYSSQMAVQGIAFALEVLRGKENTGMHMTEFKVIG